MHSISTYGAAKLTNTIMRIIHKKKKLLESKSLNSASEWKYILHTAKRGTVANHQIFFPKKALGPDAQLFWSLKKIKPHE
jgi:hypothetical protein